VSDLARPKTEARYGGWKHVSDCRSCGAPIFARYALAGVGSIEADPIVKWSCKHEEPREMRK
jgi:hypothetical protein